ncbi:MAG TPA: pyridoxal kinase, partial [Brevundimonas sp.]|nr:pyridoxal kinase [Brevundimonas sp.]
LVDGRDNRTSIPRLPIRHSGTGDLFTAFMTTWLLKGASLAGAAERATRDIQRVLRRTLDAGVFEMRIIGD